MTILDDQAKWCTEAHELLKKKKSVAELDIPAVVGTVKTLIEKIQTQAKTNPRARVTRELPGYEQRFTTLSEQAQTIKRDVVKLGERKAANELKLVGQNLTRLRDTIQLGLSEIDPTLANDPGVKASRQKAEKFRPVYEDKRRRIDEAIQELEHLIPQPAEPIAALKKLLADSTMAEPDYEKAYKQLKGLSKELKSGRESIGKLDRSLGGTSDGKLCRQAIVDATAAIQAFDDAYGLGHADVVATLNRDLAESRNGLDPKKNQTVIDATVRIEKVKKDADKRRGELKVLQDGCVDQIEVCDALMTTLEPVAEIAEIGKLLQKLSAARSLVENQQFEKASTDLGTVKNELETAVTNGELAKKAWDELMNGGVTADMVKATAVKESGAISEFPIAHGLAATLCTAVDRAKALAAERRYTEAVGLVTPLKDSLGVLKKWDWKPKEKPAAKADLGLKDLGSDEEAKVRVEFRQLSTRYVQLKDELRNEVGRLAAVGKPRAQLAPSTQTALDTQDRENAAMSDRINAATSLGARPEGTTAEVWIQALKDRLKSLKDDVESKLAAPQTLLMKELGKEQPSQDEVDRYQAGQAFEKEGRGWERARGALLRELDEIGAMLPADPTNPLVQKQGELKQKVEKLLVDGLSMTVEAYLKLAPKARDELTKKINTTLRDTLQPAIGTLRQEATKALGEARKTKATLVKGAEGLLKRLDGEFKSGILRRTDSKSPGPEYAQKLRMELAAAITMVDTDDLSVLNEGLADIRRLTTTIENLLQDSGGTSAVKKGYDEVEVARKKLETDLAVPPDSPLQHYRPNELGQLTGEFRSVLPGVLKGLSPDEAKAEIKKLDDRRLKLVGEADKAHTDHRTMYDTGLGKTTAETLSRLELARPTATALLKNLRDRHAGAAPGRMTQTQAELELRDVTMTADAAIRNEEACNTMELKSGQDALQQQSDAETLPERFDADLQVFIKNAKRRADLVYGELGRGERNASLHQQIAVHLKEARRLGSKAAKAATQARKLAAQARTEALKAVEDDIVSARQSLKLAEEAAEMFLANPLNATVASRKALKQANERWKIAVGEYVTSINTSKVRLEGLIATDGTASVDQKNAWTTTALPLLNTLVPLVGGHAFDEDTATLSLPAGKKPDELAQRRAAKETMLARLAQYERELATHPVLAYARTQGSAPVNLSALSAALTGLRSAALTS